MSKNNPSKARQKAVQPRPVSNPQPQVKKRSWILPVVPVFFLLLWAWASLYYGDAFRIARDNSFWAPDAVSMNFVLNRPYGELWYVGRALLTLFRYPWLGGLLLAFMLTMGSWLINYCLRLPARFRWVGYLPALAYVAVITYKGLNIWFETETGMIMGIPFLIFLVLAIWGIILRSFNRKPVPALVGIPRDEKPAQNIAQLLVCIVGLAVCIGFDMWQRPYVRVIDKMIIQNENQDWQGAMETARKHCTQSNRPMAANYAIGLVHTDQQADRVYDIRLDYDSLYIVGWDGQHNNGNGIYISDCSYHAGLIETAYHNCMERMVMSGPSVHLLELMVKCGLMRYEWQLADKYLHILKNVPFEGEFCEKYSAMLNNMEAVNHDPEMAHIRLTEPIHDSFENMYQAPVFMGYNLRLYEGRSTNALINSLAVCLYTKLMPDFVARLQPLQGTTLPENLADGVLLMSNKQPQLTQMFQGLDIRGSRLSGFMQAIRPYISDRPGHARELFDKYKGYYPYYYFFGNLKATKKRETNVSSNSGVN